MSEVKLLGNVAQRLDGFLTADRSEDTPEPYISPYWSSTYQTVPAQTSAQKSAEGADSDGYDCKAGSTVWDVFNPLDTYKRLAYCDDEIVDSELKIAITLLELNFIITLGQWIRHEINWIRDKNRATSAVSERPAAEGKKELISAEDEKVIKALIEDLHDRLIPDNSFVIFQAQSKLAIAYGLIKDGKAPLSDVAVYLSKAKELFETAKNAATSPEDAVAIGGLGKITERILHKVTEEDLHPIAAPGVFKGGSHKATGPKIDPNLVLRAANGERWAIKQLMRKMRNIDPGMTTARLAKMLGSNSPKDAKALARLGLAGVKKSRLAKLAATLKGPASIGEHGRDKKRDRTGPHVR